ncbi:MAG: hypothetical protein H5U02_00595 [Clostridia bacterium]|nr:hypothetical protein [Clostridia bacterium]
MAIAGKLGAVYVQDVNAAPVAFVDEATTPDAALTRYQVTNPAYRYWAPDAAITVKKNGEVITGGFVLERVGGYVVFAAPLLETDVVTVSGEALTMVQAGGLAKWSVETDAEHADATTFASGGWKEFKQAGVSWSGSCEGFWGDELFFDGLGKVVALKLYADQPAGLCFEGYALINGDGIKVQVNALVEESINFQGVGKLYPRW